MSITLAEKTVGEWVRERPARSRVFEGLGIDYCCGGKRPLSEACAKKGHDVNEVLAELESVDTDLKESEDYDALPLDGLANHIVETHHAYLRGELPRLMEMSAKVARVHGDKDPRLEQLAGTVAALSEELTSHMLKEEHMLFPVIRQITETGTLPAMPFGTLANPIRAMEAEHDGAGNALEDLSELSEGYTAPDWACNTYRALLDGLHELELDLHQHIHKENNILFPKAIALEASLRQD